MCAKLAQETRLSQTNENLVSLLLKVNTQFGPIPFVLLPNTKVIMPEASTSPTLNLIKL